MTPPPSKRAAPAPRAKSSNMSTYSGSLVMLEVGAGPLPESELRLGQNPLRKTGPELQNGQVSVDFSTTFPYGLLYGPYPSLPTQGARREQLGALPGAVETTHGECGAQLSGGVRSRVRRRQRPQNSANRDVTDDLKICHASFPWYVCATRLQRIGGGVFSCPGV